MNDFSPYHTRSHAHTYTTLAGDPHSDRDPCSRYDTRAGGRGGGGGSDLRRVEYSASPGHAVNR